MAQRQRFGVVVARYARGASVPANRLEVGRPAYFITDSYARAVIGSQHYEKVGGRWTVIPAASRSVANGTILGPVARRVSPLGRTRLRLRTRTARHGLLALQFRSTGNPRACASTDIRFIVRPTATRAQIRDTGSPRQTVPRVRSGRGTSPTAGASTVLYPSPGAQAILEVIQRHRPTLFSRADVLQRAAEFPGARRATCRRFVCAYRSGGGPRRSGGGKRPHALCDDQNHRTAASSCRTHRSHHTSPAAARPRRCDVRVVDDDGSRSRRHAGHLHVRGFGPTIMLRKVEGR
jgi:hypothetical protein